jgi:hypothetical protein
LRAALWVSNSTKRIANCSLLALICPPQLQRTGHFNREKVPLIHANNRNRPILSKAAET